jgi:anti-anti-sigma factor
MEHEPVVIDLRDDEDDGRHARVRGVLDVFTSPVLAAKVLANLPGDTRKLLIDLRDVNFVDSAGVSALVRLRQEGRARAVDVRARIGGAHSQINSTVVDLLHRVIPVDD